VQNVLIKILFRNVNLRAQVRHLLLIFGSEDTPRQGIVHRREENHDRPRDNHIIVDAHEKAGDCGCCSKAAQLLMQLGENEETAFLNVLTE